jgi:uncharacterized membrane protein
MIRYIAAYLATLAVLLAMDLLWLGVVARPLYRSGVGHLMAESANLPAALVFYLLYVLGLMYFGLRPHAAQPGWHEVAVSAGLAGLFVYASYDLTNMAVLRNWPLRLSLIDMAWGAFVSAVSTALGKIAFDRVGV